MLLCLATEIVECKRSDVEKKRIHLLWPEEYLEQALYKIQKFIQVTNNFVQNIST